MTNEEKNLKSVKGMTKWQRMRFEMLVSASGAVTRAVHLLVFVGIAILIATRIQSQTWYNWKNDERVAAMEQRLSALETNAPTGIVCLAESDSDAIVQPAPHKTMRKYWKADEHPPIEEDTALSAIGDVLGDKLFEMFTDWMWKHHPTEFFIGSFLIVGTLFILLFEGPMALIKILFGKNEKEEKQEPYEPTAEELAKMDMTLEEWKAQNLDNIYTPEAPEIEKPKGK